jgi:hypothetical protein
MHYLETRQELRTDKTALPKKREFHSLAGVRNGPAPRPHRIKNYSILAYPARNTVSEKNTEYSSHRGRTMQPAYMFPPVCARCAAAPPTGTSRVHTTSAVPGTSAIVERVVHVPTCAACRRALVWLHVPLWAIAFAVGAALFCVIFNLDFEDQQTRAMSGVLAGVFGGALCGGIFEVIMHSRLYIGNFNPDGEGITFANKEYQRMFDEVNSTILGLYPKTSRV